MVDTLSAHVKFGYNLDSSNKTFTVSVSPIPDESGNLNVVNRKWLVLLIAHGRARIRDSSVKPLIVNESVGATEFNVEVQTEDVSEIAFTVEFIENNFPFHTTVVGNKQLT